MAADPKAIATPRESVPPPPPRPADSLLNPGTALRALRRTLARKGARRTARVALRLMRYRLTHGWKAPRPPTFDLEYGVETARLQQVTSRLGDASAAWYYQATLEAEFAAAFRSLPVDPAGLHFVDFGSGAGRVVMMASLHPFRRVIGVEFSETLHAQALRNWERFRRQANVRTPAEFILADMMHWELPPEPLLAYLFNPLREPQAVAYLVERILDSLRRHPRPFWAFYSSPSLHSCWESTGAFDATETGPHQRLYRWRGTA